MGINSAQIQRLADGRGLAYREWGDLGGRAVLECHGNPGGQLLLWDEDVLERAGVRWITVDRPGIGLSDPLPGRRVVDWPADVTELADGLGVERFAVVGFSVGGAYAAACAHAMPDRVGAAALVSSITPFDRPGAFEGLAGRGYWRLARRAPHLAALGLRVQTYFARALPGVAIRAFARGVSPADRDLVGRRPELVRRGIEQVSEAIQRGAGGLVEDIRIVSGPWGFPLGEIGVPTVIWQGDDDESTPLAWGERLAGEIPGARLHAVVGDGHLLLADRLAAVLSELEEAAKNGR